MSSRRSLLLKIGGIVAAIVVLILVPYFLWHEAMDAYFASDEFSSWVQGARSYAWGIVILLLVADLFLPIPSAPVMATAGVIYGTFWGGLVGATGSIMAGLTAYGLARLAGRRAARFLATEEIGRAHV